MSTFGLSKVADLSRVLLERSWFLFRCILFTVWRDESWIEIDWIVAQDRLMVASAGWNKTRGFYLFRVSFSFWHILDCVINNFTKVCNNLNRGTTRQKYIFSWFLPSLGFFPCVSRKRISISKKRLKSCWSLFCQAAWEREKRRLKRKRGSKNGAFERPVKKSTRRLI